MSGLGGLSRRSTFLLALGLICLVAFLNALGSIGRPFWMDEAITIMSFTTRPTLLSTYLSYYIPNNHIVYTMILSLLMDFTEGAGLNYGALLRLPSLLFGLGGIALVFLVAVRRGSLNAGIALAAFLAMSCTFAVYATAVRGYMLAFLCVAGAVWLSASLVRRGGFWRFTCYFALCVVAVGTIPTDIIALEAVALASLSCSVRKRLFRRGWLFVAPVLALIVFYLPILPRFIKCMTLGEGWHSAGEAAWNLYGSFALAFLPLIPLCLWGAILLWRRRPARRISLLLLLAILLIPLPFIFLGKAVPFPRVFLPLWPLWLALLARPLETALSWFKAHFPKLKPLMGLCLLLCVWATFTLRAREPIRDLLFGEGLHDDLFMPHYMEPGYRPDLLVKRIGELHLENPSAKVFVSFRGDHFASILYGNFSNLPKELWLCDSPKTGRLSALPDDVDLYLVCAGRADLEATLSRFGREGAALIQDLGFQQLYSLPRKAKP